MTDPDLTPGRHAGVPAPDPAPDVDELVTTWGLLTEAVVAVARRLSEGLALAGPVSLAEFDVLVRLHREPTHRLPLAGMAQELGLTFAGLAKLANRMELQGSVVSASDDDAPHVIHATLTPAGDELVRSVLLSHTRDLERFVLAPLGADGLRELSALTRILRDHST